MADRIGYPTSDVSSNNASPHPSGSLFATVDDDGDSTDYIDLFSSTSFAILGFSDFGALPPGSSTIVLQVWLMWSGGTPANVEISLLEGGTTRGSTSVLPSTSNTLFPLAVAASGFASVANLRAGVSRGPGGSGSCFYTGCKIIMDAAGFEHLDLVDGFLKVVPAGTMGEIHLVNGFPVRSAGGEGSGSLILVDGFPVVHS